MKTWSIFVVLLLPLFDLAFQVMVVEVTDPIKYIYTYTGTMAIILLFTATSLSLIKNKINLIIHRRMIGLFAFFYAFLHFCNFYVFDAELDVDFVVKESLDKPFVYLGMISFSILIFMAVTSTRKLYRKFNKYHRFIYLVLILITIHFVMAQKALSIAQWVYLLLIIIIICFKIKQRKDLISKY
ncbi:ferric reductase [Arcobacter sp. 31_11_sub10_T18]|nr:ferric reductase [Arcobacter sp. 31_11_sub10_T18]